MPFIFVSSSKEKNGLKEISSFALVSPIWMILIKSPRETALRSIISAAKMLSITRKRRKTIILKEGLKNRVLDKINIMYYNNESKHKKQL